QRAPAHTPARARDLLARAAAPDAGERGDARPDRRDRRDGPADGLRPRLRALARLRAAPLRAEELPLLHRVLEPRVRVLHDPRHAPDVGVRTRSPAPRVRDLLRDAPAGAARRAHGAFRAQPVARALAFPAVGRRLDARGDPRARGARAGADAA